MIWLHVTCGLSENTTMTRKKEAKEQVAAHIGRLYSVAQAAAYLGLATWTARDLIHSGYLPRVALPSVRRPGETMRRILVDRAVSLIRFRGQVNYGDRSSCVAFS
jgi:hypothetical protein